MSGRRSWSKLVHRASRMSWDELGTRAHQELAKRSDLVRSLMGARFVDEGGEVSGVHRGHFFFEPADIPTILGFLRRRLPDVVEETVHQAHQICRHRFDLLGYRSVNYGGQIDWHLDAVNGRRAPQRVWYKVPYLDFSQVGDSKVIWELNRHQHLVTLAKAYCLTANTQFALEIFRQWYDWQQQNPYPMGINWASSLEVAFRSLSWIWISHLLQNCSIVPPEFLSDLRRALRLNGRHIARFPSTYFSPNTHLLGEGVGLFFIGTLCSGTPIAQSWQRKGWQIVLQEAERQVRPDGMHFEQSTYYHTYALDFFLHARVLANLNGIPIPARFDKTIQKMLEIICSLRRSGLLPRLGDDDGGRVFAPRRNRLEHMLDPLALGTVVFNRDDFKAAASDITEETIWLTGVEAAKRFEGLRSERRDPRSFAVESSGIHVMASSKPVMQQFVIDAGPSAPGRQGHRHADALSVQAAINGHPVLIDPGTFVYAGQDDERNLFRGTAAHNAVEVDGLSQGDPDGPFEWRDLRSARVNRWVTASTFDFFEGSHSGYRRLSSPVEHQRSTFYLKPHFLLVRDVLTGTHVHQVAVHWHFSPGHLAAEGNVVTFLGDNQTTLTVTFGTDVQWSHEIGAHWHSPEYGSKEPAPLLRSTTKAMLPVELATLLIPTSATAARLHVLEPLMGIARSPVRAYRYAADGRTEHLFVFAAAPEDWNIGPWSSDARFLFCKPSDRGWPESFALCDGSYLAFNGHRVLAAKECVRYAEFFFDGNRPLFHCSNPDAVRIDPVTEIGDASQPDMLAAV